MPHGRYVETMATLGYRHVALGDSIWCIPFSTSRLSGPARVMFICATLEGSKSGSTWRFGTTCARIPKWQESTKRSNANLAYAHDNETLKSSEAYSLAKSGFVANVLRVAMAGRDA